MDDFAAEMATSAVKTVSKEAYVDLIHPVAEPTGAVLGLLPRAIRAALLPVEKWIVVQEHNLARVKNALEEKLEGTPAEDIVTPEPYVGVPALQAASYCVDNDDLRDMYANLLASSMRKQTKSYVHPSYAQIIQQLSPDDAKILKAMKERGTNIPVIDLHVKTEGNSGYRVLLECFSPFVHESGCEHPENFLECFNNLMRLGLIERPSGVFINDNAVYDEVLKHPFVKQIQIPFGFFEDHCRVEPNKGLIRLTNFGKSFCDICISSQQSAPKPS